MKSYKKPILIFTLSFLLFFFVANIGLAQRQVEIEYPEIGGWKPTVITQNVLPDYIKYIFTFAIILSITIAFIALIYGGFRYLISRGSVTAMADAKERIGAAIVGLLVLLGSYLILTTINPQLIILKFPLFEGKPPVEKVVTPPGPQPTPNPGATQIPIAVLVDGANYSDYPGLFGEKRMELVKEILDEVKKVPFKIIELSENLKTLAARCTGDKTICSAKGMCECMGDPCRPNRASMNQTRLEINALNMALDVFLKKDQKIRDYINNYPSLALLEKTVTPAENEFCGYWEVMFHNAMLSARVPYTPAMRENYLKNCLMGLLNVPSTLSEDTLNLFNEMAVIEEKGGELEQIRDDMQKDIDRLAEGRILMKNCLGESQYKPLSLLDEDDFWKNKEISENILKIVKKIEIKKAWPDITVRNDPATFYCTEGAEISSMGGEIPPEGIPSDAEIKAQSEKIEEGTLGTQGLEKICGEEIPLGKTTDEAVELGKKIMEAIDEMISSVSSQINSTYQITLLTNGETQHCGATKAIAIPENNYVYCPRVGCPTSSDGRPCDSIQTCPMREIGGALKTVKKDVACFLNQPGLSICYSDMGIEIKEDCDYLLGEEKLVCCQIFVTDADTGEEICWIEKKEEGPYGRLLKYYEESLEIKKQLKGAREEINRCTIPTENFIKIINGEDSPRMITCEQGKTACNDLPNNYTCYGEDNPDAQTNWFCSTTTSQ